MLFFRIGKFVAKEKKPLVVKNQFSVKIAKKQDFSCNFAVSCSSGHCDISHNSGLRKWAQVKSSREYVHCLYH